MNTTCNGLSTPEIVHAVLTGGEVKKVVDKLLDAKMREFDALKKSLKEETEYCELLTRSMKLPDGTAGRKIADAILTELLEAFPDVAEQIEREKAQKAEDDRAYIEWVVNR